MRSTNLDAFAEAAILRLSDARSIEDVRRQGWIGIPAGRRAVTLEFDTPSRDRDTLLYEYWRFHPEFVFLKTLGLASRVLVVNPGEGSIIGWRHWGDPRRPDLEMYAVGPRKGEHFDKFADHDVVDVAASKMKFADAAFDAVILSHVINRVKDWPALLAEVFRVAAPEAKLYLEWPTRESTEFVPRAVLARFGVPSGTLNFYDDVDNVSLVDRESLLERIEHIGGRCITSGTVLGDAVVQELFSYGVRQQDAEISTYALWSALRFSNYLIAENSPNL